MEDLQKGIAGMDVKDDGPTFGSTVRVQQQTTNTQDDGPTFGAALHNAGDRAQGTTVVDDARAREELSAAGFTPEVIIDLRPEYEK
jgi:hypothetical protein